MIKRETSAIKKHLGHRNARPYWMHPTASSRRVARALEARTRRHTTASLKYMRLNDEVVNLREALKSCKRKSR